MELYDMMTGNRLRFMKRLLGCAALAIALLMVAWLATTMAQPVTAEVVNKPADLWTRYTNSSTSGGLAGDAIKALFVDRNSGNLYVGTTQGASVFTANSSQWVSYTKASTASGLLSDTVHSVAYFQKESSYLAWFATP